MFSSEGRYLESKVVYEPYQIRWLKNLLIDGNKTKICGTYQYNIRIPSLILFFKNIHIITD